MATEETRYVYVISVAAELAGMHAQTLRMYERKGLVRPGRTAGGNRRYSEADIRILRRIQELTNSGLNLEGVRQVIALMKENEALREEIAELKSQYKREIVPWGQFGNLLGKRTS